MRGDALAQLNMLISMTNVQGSEPRAGHQVFIDVPLRKEPLGKFCGRQTCLSLSRQMLCPRPSPLRVPRVHACSNFNGRALTDGRVLRSYARASVAPTNVVQKGLKTIHKPTDAFVATSSDAAQRLSQPISQSC
jgi:hypothetical protein